MSYRRLRTCWGQRNIYLPRGGTPAGSKNTAYRPKQDAKCCASLLNQSFKIQAVEKAQSGWLWYWTQCYPANTEKPSCDWVAGRRQKNSYKLREGLKGASKNVSGDGLARQIWLKKRSLHIINEHFEAKFNDARPSKEVFRGSLKLNDMHEEKTQ